MKKISQKIVLKEIKVAECETYHEYKGKPLYNSRFEWVLKYHVPGLAPVGDKIGAYHIDLEGKAVYNERYIRTFGFYFGRAAVISEEGWGHIMTNGEK